MLDPDTILFSNHVTPANEFFASEKVELSLGLEPLANVVIHLACAIFRLIISPFQQTLQFTAYELFSAYRNMELVAGVLLAVCNQPQGQYIMYVAKTNIDQYNYFLESFNEARETYKFLSQRLF